MKTIAQLISKLKHVNFKHVNFKFLTLSLTSSTLLFCPPIQSHAEVLNYQFPSFEQISKPIKVFGPAGEFFTFLRTGSDSGGKIILAKATIPPKSGPPPHIHTLTDEWFYFPKGGITLFCDPVQPYTLNQIPKRNGVPGGNAHAIKTKDKSLYYGPHNFIHGFYNDTDETLEMIFVWAPKPGEVNNPAADITNYFITAGRVVNEFTADLKPTENEKIAFATLAPKWGINQSTYFMEYLSSINPAQNHSPLIHGDDEVKRLESLLKTPIEQKAK